MNELVPLGWEAQIHRETYIAVLQAHLSRRGAKREFARRVGITPQYLSYLLDPYNHRTPSPATAEAMVSALEIDEHERRHLLEHLILAADRGARATAIINRAITDASVRDSAADIRELHEATQYGDEPLKVRAERRVAIQAAKFFLSIVDPWQFPIDYAYVAFVMNELNWLIGHHSQALYHAKRARFVLTMTDPTKLGDRTDEYAYCLTNARRIEAVAQHNLGASLDAYGTLYEAQNTPGAQHRPEFWLPHLYRDKLNAIAHLARPSVAEAEALALHGTRLLAQHNVAHAELLAILLERSLASVYMHAGQTGKAFGLLARLSEDMVGVPDIGTLPRYLVLSAYAYTSWIQRDRETWAEVLTGAVELGEQAGLTHQLGLLARHYIRLPVEAMELLSPTVQRYLRPPGRKAA